MLERETHRFLNDLLSRRGFWSTVVVLMFIGFLVQNPGLAIAVGVALVLAVLVVLVVAWRSESTRQRTNEKKPPPRP